MAQVSSKVVINQLAVRKLTQAAVQALETTAEALHTEVGRAQVVPFDKGTLSGEGFFVDTSRSADGTVSLVHSTPYARRLYVHPEYNFSKEEHPHAQGEWFNKWLENGDEADFVPKTFAKFYKELTGV